MKRRTFASAALSMMALPAWATVSDSVYQLDIRLTDQSGQTRALDSLRGHPVLVTMFYTSCQMACPMLIEAIRANEAALTPHERERLSVLMVSFDVQRDTVEVLRNTARDRDLPAPHWTLARTDERSVRRLAAVLGIRYRQMADGDFNHSSTVLLLDAEGRIAARTNRLSKADAAMVGKIKALTA
jgi:protein SCO1/2